MRNDRMFVDVIVLYRAQAAKHENLCWLDMCDLGKKKIVGKTFTDQKLTEFRAVCVEVVPFGSNSLLHSF